MEGLGRFCPSSLLDPGSGATSPGSGSEAWTPSPHARCAPTKQPRRRRCPDSPRESRSLTDVATGPPDGARRPRPHGRLLEDAWGVPGAGAQGPAWRRQPPGPWHCPPARGGSPPPCPEGASSPPGGTFGVQRAQSGDQWAVPQCGGAGRRSLSSALSQRSSGPSQECAAPAACACAHLREGSDPGESAARQPSQPSASREERPSPRTQLLRTELEEALTTSGGQKIVALVLTRLRKAQRMRELQQQAAAAWEELRLSDQKVQRTLERERERLLHESREQWRQQERRVRRRHGPARPDDDPERAPKLAPSIPRQSRELRAPEPERPERAGPRQGLHPTDTQEPVRETNLSSLVNYQARKVLLDCQAKAEELLRKLSQEQGAQRCPGAQPGLGRELGPGAQRPREPLQQVRRRRRGEAGEQVPAHKGLLTELAERRARRAGGGGDELGVLRGENQHILKLKAEKEGKCHIEGIKEAIRRKQQRREHISREQDATLEEFEKLSRAPRGDQARALAGSLRDRRAREEAGPQGC
ncbi:coiled-coil domain-containing protein 185 [Herpailurus yagouaroundi]|uniref:coiled-coil domain-containing protein 185 n=1 Tax=Herpailurus yagouaroundi TaxID=1608482 RepID=UPI001AD6C2E2|nr:coiled-coil domain-containing protein 185 [Puma yagouaroundi]